MLRLTELGYPHTYPAYLLFTGQTRVRKFYSPICTRWFESHPQLIHCELSKRESIAIVEGNFASKLIPFFAQHIQLISTKIRGVNFPVTMPFRDLFIFCD